MLQCANKTVKYFVDMCVTLHILHSLSVYTKDDAVDPALLLAVTHSNVRLQPINYASIGFKLRDFCLY